MKLQELLDQTGRDVFDHLHRQVAIPVIDGLQAQGDLIVIPMAMVDSVTTRSWARWRTIPLAGVELVRGVAGNNPHTLIAGARETCRWTTDWSDQTSLAVAIFHNTAPAYLLHPEHGASGVAPGTWLVRRQGERGFYLNRPVLVAD